RRVRAEGLTGVAVAAVMRDNGLTHGGFYKHFPDKDELILESLQEAFREITDVLTHAAKRAKSEEPWKTIVKTYLSVEYCEHAERGCPLPTLAPELARVKNPMKGRVVAELLKYKERMVPFMPGRRVSDRERAFFVIFSTMTGAIEIARLLPNRDAQEKVLASVREHLLRSF